VLESEGDIQETDQRDTLQGVVVPRFEALIGLLDNEAWPVDIVSGILMDAAVTNMWIGIGCLHRVRATRRTLLHRWRASHE
jgi:hypothetical protein